jgi:excisionase family DNA binding protein
VTLTTALFRVLHLWPILLAPLLVSALTAEELAKFLSVSKVTIFKQAAAGRIPSFRVGTCVRFDPRAVAQWLRSM